MELALQWEESQRAVMHDPAYSGFFMHSIKDGSNYNEPIHFGDQYFWDFRNESAQEYFVSSVLASLSDDAVDGTCELLRAVTRLNATSAVSPPHAGKLSS